MWLRARDLAIDGTTTLIWLSPAEAERKTCLFFGNSLFELICLLREFFSE
jgi:hypothetical protein